MENKEKVRLIVEAIEEKLGENIRIINIEGISMIADYFIIASANNSNHLDAVSEEIQKKLEQSGIVPKHIEGTKNASWILLDYQDIVIHIFDKETRIFYDLERIWRDGKIEDVNTYR